VKVVVLSGGRSSEHDVSLRSGAAVAAGLREAGHEVVAVTIERDGRWLLGGDGEGEEVSLAPGRGLLGADVVFPVLHGPYGEDGVVQGALEVLGVPYVGSGVPASALCIDKIACKRLLAFHGVPQVGFVAVGPEGCDDCAEGLGFPLWVKPARLGSSVGISRVDEAGDLDAAIEAARKHDPRVILEAHCDGREVECSVLGNPAPAGEGAETSLPGEVIAKGDWYDFESKYEPGGMDLIVPADLPEATLAEVRALAVQVFTLTGCAGLARCDFFVTPDNRILVNELNTLPGFTETSVFAKLWKATGLAYPNLCDRLVHLAIERHERDRQFEY
jgi:D-alanine-D-alanine ligase